MRRFLLAFMLPLFLACNLLTQQTPATYHISGTVVDAATGVPLPRAQVSISAKAEEIRTVTDPGGSFRLDGLEPGKYAVYGEVPGYVRSAYNQHGGFSTAVAVGPDLDSDRVVLRLHRQAVIYGRITNEQGDGVRRAQVYLFSAEKRNGKQPNFLGAMMDTDDLGEFRFAHLLAGKYYLVVQSQPWYARTGLRYAPNRDQANHSFGGTQTGPNDLLDVIYPITFYPGVSDEHRGAEINLVDGENEEANIQLLPVPALHLRLTNVSLSPKEGIGVTATQTIFGGSSLNVQVFGAPVSDGEYELSGLPPTDVALEINRFRDGEPHSETIKVNANQEDTVDSTQKGPTANVSGRVIFSTNNEHPERSNVVLVRSDNQRNSGTRLLKDGTFSMASVQAGTYHVYVNVPGPEQQLVGKISAIGATVSGGQVTTSSSGDVQLTIIMARGVAHVDGVAQLDGKPAPGTMVLLVPDSGENLEDRSRMDQSNSDGTFSLSNILPGRYLLMAIEDGWDLEWMNPDVLKPYCVKGTVLQLAPNQSIKVSVEVQRLSRTPN